MDYVRRKYFNESYYYLDEGPATPAPSAAGADWDEDVSTSIPAHLYIQRVASLHAEGFAKELASVAAAAQVGNADCHEGEGRSRRSGSLTGMS